MVNRYGFGSRQSRHTSMYYQLSPGEAKKTTHMNYCYTQMFGQILKK
jgi:hypothetical protein